jgi:AcrR family transcriptional regulator
MNNLTLREKEKLRRKKQILAAARRVFAKRGFHESTLIEIAREAHLGKATLYWYFADKARLFRAVFEDAIDEQLRTVEKAIEDTPDCRSRLEAIARGQLKHFAKNQYLLRLHGSEAGFPREEMRRDLKGFMMRKYGLYTQLLEKIFASGIEKGEIKEIDAGRTAHVFIAVLHSIAWYWHLRGVRPQPEEEARQVCDIIFEGLGNR